MQAECLAVEVAIDKLLEELRIGLCLSTEILVWVGREVADQHVDGDWIEDATSFVDSTVLT